MSVGSKMTGLEFVIVGNVKGYFVLPVLVTHLFLAQCVSLFYLGIPCYPDYNSMDFSLQFQNIIPSAFGLVCLIGTDIFIN